MSAEFAVYVESPKSGKTLLLRRGFKSRDEAEDHPVVLAQWRRVWVEPIEPKPVPRNGLPPLPWTIEWNSNGHAYVRDADGFRIMSLLGTQVRRERVAEIVCSLREPTA